MLKFLSFIRRTFLGGILSLIVVVALTFTTFQGIAYPYSYLVGRYFIYFCLASVVLGFVFWILSAIVIRKRGQFAASHQTQSFFTTLIRMLGSDISYPFRFISVKSRFIPFIIKLVICVIGIVSSVSVVSQFL